MNYPIGEGYELSHLMAQAFRRAQVAPGRSAGELAVSSTDTQSMQRLTSILDRLPYALIEPFGDAEHSGFYLRTHCVNTACTGSNMQHRVIAHSLLRGINQLSGNMAQMAA